MRWELTDNHWRSLSGADREVGAASGAPAQISVDRLVMKLYLLDIELENGSVCRVLNISLASSLRKHIGSASEFLGFGKGSGEGGLLNGNSRVSGCVGKWGEGVGRYEEVGAGV